MTEEICANCGKTREEHLSYLEYCSEAEFEDYQELEPRFKPKNHSPTKSDKCAQDGFSNSLSSLDKKDTSNSKGCGKEIKIIRICGVVDERGNYLCPECQEKN